MPSAGYQGWLLVDRAVRRISVGSALGYPSRSAELREWQVLVLGAGLA
jgi:hypothetical protein